MKQILKVLNTFSKMNEKKICIGILKYLLFTKKAIQLRILNGIITNYWHYSPLQAAYYSFFTVYKYHT